MISYNHHLGDYAKNTAHLSMLEDGAYRRLLDLYYLHEQRLPAEKRALYRLVRAAAPSERKAVDIILEELFQRTDEGWLHSRCEEEIAKYREKSDKARTSAARRWQGNSQSQRKANAHANASEDGMRMHSEGNANHKPVSRPAVRGRTSRWPGSPPARC
ncbi:hypothetical protein PIGHUM_02924 [Pigmentiphaga humi]|uniref:DUF1376 domain-containing protein n=1 Tax=Pigmentiphaga humi TaxID=2478468 RepID=A0A3P4B6P2_9BURK|nr:YdaU family protein [Pigmentiphaga humi]VCU70845.1 hypothetical protein PIGHUM_02924 [Pigmentiphaga humi]